MAGSGKKWLIGCGVGCAAVVLLSILGVVGSVLVLTRPFDRAVSVQRELTDNYGTREDFVPAAEGISPQRVKVFIAVRKSLLGHCEGFEEVKDAFAELEELDEGDGASSTPKALKGVGRMMSVVLGLPGKIGGFIQDRNEALLEYEMGLGEYTWIYILAYNSYLGKTPNTGFEDDEGSCYAGSEWRTLQHLIDNHINALEEAGRTGMARQWQEELERLERSDETVPFPEGELPPYLADSFRQYHKKLEFTYCSAMADLDLNTIKKKGLGYRSD